MTAAIGCDSVLSSCAASAPDLAEARLIEMRAALQPAAVYLAHSLLKESPILSSVWPRYKRFPLIQEDNCGTGVCLGVQTGREEGSRRTERLRHHLVLAQRRR